MSNRKHLKIKNKFKFIRSSLILILLVILISCLFNYFYDKETAENHETIQTSYEVIPEEKKDTTIKISVIGDIMCHNTQYKDAFNSSTNTYDFSYVFSEIEPYFKNNDLNIGNLETTFCVGKSYSSYPTFNTPEALATDLKELGINVLSTANNHSLDTGFKGISSTLDVLDNIGIEHMGTYRTEEESNTLLIKDVKGIKIAFLSYTYGTNGIPIPSSKPYCVNLIDRDKILSDINNAKENNVDLICANMHWGAEYLDNPNNEQKNLANFLFTNGVDIIFGSHPHVLEKMEKVNVTTVDGENKECFVIYSLGNFVSGQVKDKTRTSIILNLSVTKKSDNSIIIDNINYIPIYCYTKNKGKGFKIIDIQKELNNYNNGGSKYINSSNHTFYKNELERVKKVLNWNL